jgi:GxxExxY protein
VIAVTVLHVRDGMPERYERERLDELSNRVIGAAIEVHRELGPGTLEKACETCLAFELRERGLHVERQVTLPLVYRGQRLSPGYRIDLLVEKELIIEVKAVERVERIHLAQLRHYLKHAKLKLGLLINFNVRLLRDGIKRVVNGLPET